MVTFYVLSACFINGVIIRKGERVMFVQLYWIIEGEETI
jgi:hypothetical protein